MRCRLCVRYGQYISKDVSEKERDTVRTWVMCDTATAFHSCITLYWCDIRWHKSTEEDNLCTILFLCRNGVWWISFWLSLLLYIYHANVSAVCSWFMSVLNTIELQVISRMIARRPPAGKFCEEQYYSFRKKYLQSLYHHDTVYINCICSPF